MSSDEQVRFETFKCARCSKDLQMDWVYVGTQCKGFNSNKDYVVVADWVFHSSCWDKLIEEHPP